MKFFNFNTPFAAGAQAVDGLNQGYEASRAASMDRAPKTVWLLALLALVTLLLGAAGLSAALLKGVADPPRPARVMYQTDSLDGLLSTETPQGVTLYAMPVMPDASFTLEAEASNGSGDDAAWGIWLRADGDDRVLLVDNRGYMLTTLDSVILDWREFIHSYPPRNLLYAYAENGRVTFRINQELVMTIAADQVEQIGLALYAEPRLSCHGITVRADINAE